jgi:hypothetical protein
VQWICGILRHFQALSKPTNRYRKPLVRKCSEDLSNLPLVTFAASFSFQCWTVPKVPKTFGTVVLAQ